MNKKVKINIRSKVIAYKSGPMLEMSTTFGNDLEPTVKPLNKEEYIDLTTGEIKKYENHSQSRIENIKSLKRTFKKIRRIVATNFSAGDLWLTLTYAQPDGKPMKDTKKVYKDFDLFKRKLKRKIGNFEYFRSLRTTN